MPVKIVDLLFLAFGTYFIYYGAIEWHFKVTDTSLLPQWTPHFIDIFGNLIFGIGLIFLSYTSFKKLKFEADLSIVLLGFTVFHDIQYFIYYGLIFWLIGMSILLSNISILYKLITVLLICLISNSIGGAIYHIKIIYVSILLLIINIYINMGNISTLAKYKMEPMNKLILGIILLPYLLSEVIELI